MDNTITTTRKYALIPEFSDRKEWKKRVYDFTINDLEQKIDYRNKKKQDASELESQLEYIKNGGDFTRSMVNNYTYSLVRTAIEEEARRKNYILSWIFSEMRANRVDQMESLKDKFKFVSDTINYAYRKAGSN